MTIKCWDQDPNLRPTFAQIVDIIDQHLAQLHANGSPQTLSPTQVEPAPNDGLNYKEDHELLKMCEDGTENDQEEEEEFEFSSDDEE